MIKPTSKCPSAQKFYVHKYSDIYDFLLGQKYLEDTKTKINYEKELLSIKCLDPKQKEEFAPMDQSNPKQQKDKTALAKCLKRKLKAKLKSKSNPNKQKEETASIKCPTPRIKVDTAKKNTKHLYPKSIDDDIVNFPIYNELREYNEYRLEHVEEVE